MGGAQANNRPHMPEGVTQAPHESPHTRQACPGALHPPGMSMSAAAAAQKPAVLTSLRPAATDRRRTFMTQSPVQPPALLAANMVR